MNTQTATVTAINPSLEIESTNAPLVNVNNTSAMVLNGDSMDKMLKFSQMMATSKITIPKHLQGNAGDCFAIVMQAMQWGMNPFAVAQKTHLVNGVLGYEAQLVNAVINSRAPITTRLNYEWFGDWSKVNGKTSNADDVGVIV
ncbi:MAG TPA: recombinase RecT, partial [Agitococcus sp.]|nr:recombinase RecT [Agitococcus sp.]